MSYCEEIEKLLESHKTITYQIDELLVELAHVNRKLQELQKEPNK